MAGVFEGFVFTENVISSSFRGEDFYNAHKNDLFLRDETAIKNILTKGREIKKAVRDHPNGVKMPFAMKAGENVVVVSGGTATEAKSVSDLAYTPDRLQGMVAAYLALNHTQFHTESLVVPIAVKYGIGIGSWTNERQRLAYLSFTPGARLFGHVFKHWITAAAVYAVKKDLVLGISGTSAFAASAMRAKDATGTLLRDLAVQNRAEIKETYLSMASASGGHAAAAELLISTLFD